MVDSSPIGCTSLSPVGLIGSVGWAVLSKHLRWAHAQYKYALSLYLYMLKVNVCYAEDGCIFPCWSHIILAVRWVGSSTDLIVQKVEFVLIADEATFFMNVMHIPAGLAGTQSPSCWSTGMRNCRPISVVFSHWQIKFINSDADRCTTTTKQISEFRM
jgi:hypothetical protein